MALGTVPWDLAALVVALAIIVPWRGLARVRWLLQRPELSSRDRIRLYVSTMAAQWIVVGVTVWRCWARGWDAAFLGVALPHPMTAVTVGLALVLLFGFTQLSAFRGLSRIPVEERGRIYQVAGKLMPRSISEAALFVALVATVSLCEEFLYRGFVFAVFLQLTSNSAIALVSSSLLFGLGHAYQGRRGVFLTCFLGAVFGIARIYTGSLVPGAMAHFVVDILAGLAAPGGLFEARQRQAT